MAIRSISFTNYRGFRQRQEIAIRPLTILLGRNNVGKSAIARLPSILRTGLTGSPGSPLRLETISDVFRSSFVEMIHGHRPHGSIGLGIELDGPKGGVISVDWVIQNVSEIRDQIVSRFSYADAFHRLDLTWLESDLETLERGYRVNDEALPRFIRFDGLIPRMASDEAGDLAAASITELADLLTKNFFEVRHIGPFRDVPERFYRMPHHAPGFVGTRGESAPAMIAIDETLGSHRLVTLVNDMLSEGVAPGWALDVDAGSGLEELYALVLASVSDPELRINLADTGTGVAQVLPVLVQRASDHLLSPESVPLGVESVEQPELHLHPAAHPALADVYLGARLEPRRFIIETHSETFVLRLRRRIAEGIDHSQVGIFFVTSDGLEASVREIPVDDEGNVSDWPAGVFDEDFEEARAIVRAQRREADGRTD